MPLNGCGQLDKGSSGTQPTKRPRELDKQPRTRRRVPRKWVPRPCRGRRSDSSKSPSRKLPSASYLAACIATVVAAAGFPTMNNPKAPTKMSRSHHPEHCHFGVSPIRVRPMDLRIQREGGWVLPKHDFYLASRGRNLGEQVTSYTFGLRKH